jgi:hypothetical protein
MANDKLNAPASNSPGKAADDLLWGAQAIADEAGLKLRQVYSLFESGALDGAVSKLGHRTSSVRAEPCAPFPSKRAKRASRARRFERASGGARPRRPCRLSRQRKGPA